jgi:AraC-like DNA-binding protein
MLKYVKDGNLQYKQEMDRLISMGDIGKFAEADFLRQAKNSVIILITLVSRAAIEGGLPAETAMLLSDKYIQSVEASDSHAKVSEISQAMREDYIRRVYRVKNDGNISPGIQQACDYISLHPEQKLDVHELAQKLGYTDYYFTKKFKREAGMTINEFAMLQKIERAKELLIDTSLSISEISSQLGFNSASYFCDMFRRLTNKSPGEHRVSKNMSDTV